MLSTVSSGRISATPKLAVMAPTGPRCVTSRRARSFSARRAAPAASVIEAITANSSPPHRATKSDSRTRVESMRAVPASTWSPTW